MTRRHTSLACSVPTRRRGAIDHCPAECVGLHAAKSGTRFEALEPVRQGGRDHFGAMAAGAASGFTIRHDYSSQYMSDDCHAELRFLGIVASPAFVRQPEGNGCIERSPPFIGLQPLGRL